MNKFKRELEKIQLTEGEKREMLNKIKENKKESKFKVYSFRLAVVVLVFAACCMTSYAAVKIFKLDNSFKNWFNVSEDNEEDYGIGGTDVNENTEFDDVNIKINQTVYDGKSLYVSVSVTGKDEAKYVDDVLITEGNAFDESLEEMATLEDGSIYRSTKCTQEVAFCEGSVALLEEEDKTIQYGYEFTVNHEKELINQPLTLRLYIDNKAYDVTFVLSQNDMKSKEVEFDTIVYQKEDVIVKVKSVKVTPMHVLVTLDYNVSFDELSEEILADIDNVVYSYNGTSNNVITYKDGTTQALSLRWTHDEASLTTPYADYVKDENWQVVDIDTVQSITINNITFEIN